MPRASKNKKTVNHPAEGAPPSIPTEPSAGNSRRGRSTTANGGKVPVPRTSRRQTTKAETAAQAQMELEEMREQG